MAKLCKPKQTPNIGSECFSESSQRPGMNPTSAELHGEPGPGPTTTAEKHERCGSNSFIVSASLWIIWTCALGIVSMMRFAKLNSTRRLRDA